MIKILLIIGYVWLVVGATLLVVTYALVPWWRSALGRSLMTMFVAVFALTASPLLRLFSPLAVWVTDVVRLVLTYGTGLGVWLVLSAMIATQIAGRRAERKAKSVPMKEH